MYHAFGLNEVRNLNFSLRILDASIIPLLLFHWNSVTSHPMTTLDWYILKKMLVTFIFCMLLFTLIAVAVDISEKTDDFVQTGLSSGAIFTRYYFGFIPFIWGLLFPLFVFIAVIFFTSRLAARSEIIAILASGTSYNRVLRPYFIGGVFLAIILWYANRYVIPKANEIKSNFQTTYLDGNDPLKGRNFTTSYYLQSDANTFIGIRYYDTAAKRSSGFFLEKIKDNKIVYNLRAETLFWDTAHKNWRIENVVERKVGNMKETVRQLTDTTIDLKMKPEDLRQDEYLKDKLTTPQLKRYILNQEQRGVEGLNVLKVEQYRRSATPVTVLILTLIGAVIASRKTRGGSGVHMAMGIGIAAIFIISDRFSTVFSIKGNLPPVIAAWLPNLVFLIVAILLYRRTPK
ncbi:MAG TPA: LptF/LptG family permease [Chitinophagaceae bacterium]